LGVVVTHLISKMSKQANPTMEMRKKR
jgi:hypothetical protein